ncbi:NAD(P)/FAD-dependent oxidoreductase [Pediococcus ethanolidurans]|uniref:dihydrolipoyl dehydrogenase family protein n=1 Tax=Pediococcus ethanolidurans TaxID=319653 RepID=UPI001C1EC5BA|nr:NAD(P)/FAD-dependent oxidoreductase [Pediococcus ethanolidurans]MBU7563764.1 NAD(P)/FAD-dependent oxidoreductase [Pediococcus ethanolidurans]
MDKFDVVVIGAGPGGSALAYALKAQNKKVAIVEENLWGGTCPNLGCDPKKVILAAVDARRRAQNLVGKGLQSAPVIDWPALISFEKTFTDPVSDGTKKGLQDAGITVIDGSVKFVDKHTILADQTKVVADKFVIATGARPKLLDVDGKRYFETSTDFLKMTAMPHSITFVGGGYIAFEFAAMAAAVGEDVHIIHHNDRPLKAFAKADVDRLIAQLEDNGVHFHFGVDISRIENNADGYELVSAQGFSLQTDKVFCTAGRIPNDDTLALDKVGVEFSNRGIKVNDHLQTTSENIFALGDVLDKSQPKLTPVSGFEAQYLAELFAGQTQAIKYPAIPTVVYGTPRLAMVGLSVEKAEAQKDNYTIQNLDLTGWFTYHRLNEPLAYATVITSKKTCAVVGASLMSGEADELINYFAMAINRQLTPENLKQTIFAYPTTASDLTYLM